MSKNFAISEEANHAQYITELEENIYALKREKTPSSSPDEKVRLEGELKEQGHPRAQH